MINEQVRNDVIIKLALLVDRDILVMRTGRVALLDGARITADGDDVENGDNGQWDE